MPKMQARPYDGPTPTEGMDATIGIGGDRYPAKVTKVVSAKRIEVNGDVWTLRKDGRWRRKGTDRSSGYGLCLGVAEDYRDPHF